MGYVSTFKKVSFSYPDYLTAEIFKERFYNRKFIMSIHLFCVCIQKIQEDKEYEI